VLAIRDLLWHMGGFIEHAWLDTPDRFNSHYSATLRVPAEGYYSFLEGLRQIGEITHLAETTVDHTDAYFDASIRLDTRRIEEVRILELIERAQAAGEIADILELERLLRNVRLEIEGLTRQIDHIDRLVAMHTIHLTLFEVDEDGPIAALAFIDRAGVAFVGSANFMVVFSRFLATFVAAAIAPAALLLAALLLFRVVARRWRSGIVK